MGGQFDQKWSDQQREALIHAMFDADPFLTPAEAARRARAGTLKPGLEPFPIPTQTVYSHRDAERLRRRTLNPEIPLPELRNRIAREAAELLIQRFEAERKRGDKCDPRTISAIWDALGKIGQAKAPTEEGNGRSRSGVLGSLVPAVDGAAVPADEDARADQDLELAGQQASK